jgi:transposase
MNCRATTQGGRPCRRRAMGGSELCHAHRGVAVGRPSKLTAELQRRLCDALRAGNHLEVAARYAGISRPTLHRWLSEAREDGADPSLIELRAAVSKAEADAEVHAVGVVRKAIAQGDWRAALAYLERRHPQRWRRREPAAAPDAGAPAGAGDLDISDPTTRALLSELLRRRKADR